MSYFKGKKAKFNFSSGSAPDPGEGAYSAPPEGNGEREGKERGKGGGEVEGVDTA